VRKRYLVAVVACAAVLLGAASAYALTRGVRDVSGTDAGGQSEVRLRAGQFRIGGDSVKPLAPGSSAPINVTFTNLRGSTLVVERLRVRVRAVSAPNADADHPCSRADFNVRQVPAGFSVRVGPNATRSLQGLDVPVASWPRVRMVNRPVNQDGCKGASLSLSYGGSGSLRR
jgi:hypothetical protein